MNTPTRITLAAALALTLFAPAAFAAAPAPASASSAPAPAHRTAAPAKPARTITTGRQAARELALTRIPMNSAYSTSTIRPSAIRNYWGSLESLLMQTPSINVDDGPG